MKKTFKLHDIVTCVNRGGNYYITEGKQYTVNDIMEDDGTIRVTDDQGDEGWYHTNRFHLVEQGLFILIAKAQSLLDKYYTHGTAMRHKCTRIKVYLQEPDFNNGTGSGFARDMFKELGYAVVVGDASCEFDVRNVKEVPNFKELVLTPDYTAEVYADKVIVGCQTIPYDKVVELLKTMDGLSY